MKLYPYVGPAEIKARVAGRLAGTRVASLADLLAWIRGTGQRPGPDGLVAATFVIDASGDLLLADRRSEHVACAGGGPVLSAGEMFFCVVGDNVEVAEASNQSTGFCPEPESWLAVAAALDRIGVAYPGRFTDDRERAPGPLGSEPQIARTSPCGHPPFEETKMDTHPCPVCGYALCKPPWDAAGVSFQICPCCGIQFGYDDASPGGEDERKKAHSRLRERWVEAGMPWWSEAPPMPAGWDAEVQLRRAGFPGPTLG